jgi:hypothetical protein
MNNFKNTLKRIRFYFLLLGGFLGIEIPLVMLIFFHFFPKFRGFAVFVTLLVSLGTALFVFNIIARILREDFEMRLIFGNSEFDQAIQTEGNRP